MKQIAQILTFLLALISCSANTRRSIPDYVTKWNFVQLYIDEYNPISDSLRHELLKTTVIFSNDTIIINSKYRAKFVMEREHTSTFFGNYSVIGDIYMDILNRNGCDISDSISYIRLVNYCDSDFDTFDEFSFDSYSLWQTLICTEDFLCIPYEKFNVLLYKKSVKEDRLIQSVDKDNGISSANPDIDPKENLIHTSAINRRSDDIKSLYSKISPIPLPIKFSSDFILNAPDFIDLPSELYSTFFSHDAYKDQCKIAKLPPNGNISCLLLRVRDYGSDEYLLYLFTMSDTYAVIDSLSIYYIGDMEMEGELGTVSRSFRVSNEYSILIEEHFSGNKKELLLNRETYNIDTSGKFIEVK